MLAGQLALSVAAVFAGAAIYVSVAEQPARLHPDDRSLLAEWKPAYQRGFAMQASLAVIGFLAGLLAWWQTDDWRWLRQTRDPRAASSWKNGEPYTPAVRLSASSRRPSFSGPRWGRA